MRAFALLCVSFLSLTGCTSSYIKTEAIASNDAVEQQTNSLLVTNILRERDGVPTYYTDISHLRGSLQEQAQVAVPIGFGRFGNWTGRDLVSPGFSITSNPSFDVAPLNTESFTRGINEPIDVRVLQYYLDRSISPELLLLLFIDKIEDVSFVGGRAIVRPYYNIFCENEARGCQDVRQGAARYFDEKIRNWASPYLVLHAYRLLLPHGPPFSVSDEDGKGVSLKDFARFAGGPSLVLRPVDGSGPGARYYRYFQTSEEIALCVPSERNANGSRSRLALTVKNQNGSVASTQAYEIIRIARNTVSGAASISQNLDPAACVKTEIFGEYDTPSKTTRSYTAVHFRSVDGMIEFLGRMLRLPREKRPMNFDISADDVAQSRFSVAYRGETYHVHDAARQIRDTPKCTQGGASADCSDRTLEVLTLVNQLLNLHKNRSDLPSTGAVQVVN